MRLLVLLIAGASLALSAEDSGDTDGEYSRKILGSSVVTSVSVIMDTGNGSKTVFTDAVGKPVPKPSSASELASPIDLLNPDRYEFYTFDDNGDLIKRLMSLEEIQGIIATGDSDGYDFDSFTSLGYLPEKRVNDVVNNVQNVLKEEMATHKTPPDPKPVFDTPDVSDSWSMILPAVFGNSGEDIKPEKPITHVTPDTIMLEPTLKSSTQPPPTSQKITSSITTFSSFSSSASTPRSTSTSQTPSPKPLTESDQKPVINVEIFSNSISTTEKPIDQISVENKPILELKPSTIYSLPTTTALPTTTKKSSSTVTIELPSKLPTLTGIKLTSSLPETITKQPQTFIPISIGSTLPTTKAPIRPTVEQLRVPSTSTLDLTQAATSTGTSTSTKLTTQNHLSTWRPGPFSAATTETETITQEPLLSTWVPKLTTTDKPQPPPKADYLPTLAQLLNLNKNTESTPSGLTATTTAAPETTKKDTTLFSVTTESIGEQSPTTTEYSIQDTTQSKTNFENVSTQRYVAEDLSTLNSEWLTTTLNETSTLRTENQVYESTTELPLEQSLNSDQKASATELLDQLLFTTNIYEINTELAEKTTEQQIFSNDDERFDTNTQEETKISEVKTELPITTTEQFLIKVTDEESTSDKTLMESIEQLLSQAVGNVEEVITTINNTQTIQDMLGNSNAKNMTQLQADSATVASSLVDTNDNARDETTTTQMSMLDAIASGESSILSESVGSLLSQIYESSRPTITTNDIALSTEKYPTPTVTASASTESEDKIEISTLGLDKLQTLSESNTVKNEATTSEPELTSTSGEIINESTTITYIPVNTVDKNDVKNTSKDNGFETHLINITIISSDITNNNIRNSSYKPAKLDVSLEQMLDEEFKRNASAFESTAVTEPTPTTTEKLEDKSPNEILNAEETMAALYNNPDLTSTEQPTTETTTQYTELLTTEYSTEASTLDTTEKFVPVREVPKRPTTIIIIKKTEKPPTLLYTTVNPVESNEDTEITSVLDDTVTESTTYFKPETETTTQSVTERVSPSTTDLRDTNAQGITEKYTAVQTSKDTVGSETKVENSNLLNSTSTTENTKEKESDKIQPQQLSSTTTQISTTTESLKQQVSSVTNQQPSHGIVANKPESTWTLVPTIPPHKEDKPIRNDPSPIPPYPEVIDPPAPVDLEPKPLHGFGLEESTSRLDTDIYQFAQLCNELAFGFWKTVTSGLSSARSVFVSPFGATSLLAMVFLGARGATSGEMNEILRLDDMVTFNPHLIFKNVSESIKADEQDSGVASSAIIRELFSDRSKGKLLPFYKERAKAFYDGYVEEASFREIGDVIRRRTNLQVKKYTNGKISEYLKDSTINARPPLAGVSVNIFQTDCSQASTEGRDGELHFVVLPSIRQRRLIPVPAVVYKSGFLAGYEPSLDATAVALGTKDQTISTILVIPGQQGILTPGDGLARLEKRLVESSFKKGAWSRLLRSLIPRPGVEVQIPRFSHKSVINATVALKKMGLHELFDVEKADLRGLNGVANELFLSDMLQINTFATCGEKRIGETHHSEIYPATALRARNSRYMEHFESEESFWRSDLLEEPRDYQRAFPDPLLDFSFLSLPLSLRPRQARIPETPRLKFDRPFIYFVRHNPTGLILHMGRFNPRLLP